MNRTTGAQRYNARMDKIFAEAKVNNAKRAAERLAAAAPDLLAALGALLNCPDLAMDELEPSTLDAIEDARAAMAKAVQS